MSDPESKNRLSRKSRRFFPGSSAYFKLIGFLNKQPQGHYMEDWGTMLTIFAYLIFSIFFTTYHATWHPLILAFRLGLISVVNVPILYILGAKHTPFSWLTGWSYEQLNVYHRHVGRVCVITLIGHAGIFFYYFRWGYLVTHVWSIMGLAAGLMFILIGLTSIRYIRAKLYEFFYAVHFIGLTVSIPAIYFHIPYARPYAVAAGLSFIYDRLARVVIDYRVIRCHAEIHDGDTIILRVPKHGQVDYENVNEHKPFFLGRHIKWNKGQHVYLSVIGCGMWQSHPFTIASSYEHSNSLDVIIRARSGFTKKFHDGCVKNPDKEWWVIIHGPYGVVPSGMPECSLNLLDPAREIVRGVGDTAAASNTGQSSSETVSEVTSLLKSPDHNYFVGNLSRPPSRKILLVAGGAGVAFVYPLFQHYRSLIKGNDDQDSEGHEHYEQLELNNDQGYKLRAEEENLEVKLLWIISKRSFQSWIDDPDPRISLWVTEERGRPNIQELVEDQIADSEICWVACCGPDSLLRGVRNCIADINGKGRMGVKFYAEKFGW